MAGTAGFVSPNLQSPGATLRRVEATAPSRESTRLALPQESGDRCRCQLLEVRRTKGAKPWNKEALGTVRGQLDALPPIGGLATDVRSLHDGQSGNNPVVGVNSPYRNRCGSGLVVIGRFSPTTLGKTLQRTYAPTVGGERFPGTRGSSTHPITAAMITSVKSL